MSQASSRADRERSSISAPDKAQTVARFLTMARIFTVMITLLVVILDTVSIPVAYQFLQTPCSPCAPNTIQLTTGQSQQFLASGWSHQTYAMWMLIFIIITQSVYIGIGLLLLLRRSNDGMALFTSLTLTTFGGAAFTGTMHALANVNTTLSILTYCLNIIGQFSFITFLFIFPTGRFVPRWVIIPDILWTLSWIAPLIHLPALDLLAALINAGPFFILLLLALVIAQIYRYGWVSTPTQRQQTKWVVFGLGIGLTGFTVGLVLGNVVLSPSFVNQPLPTLISDGVFDIFFMLIPVAIAIAVMRSRLYDIDIVIKRTLVYGSLTAILAGLYFGLVIGAQLLTRQFSGQQSAQQPIIIVLSTLLIAALFQPLRAWLQRGIDRRFYRSRYDAARTIATFSDTLRQEVELDMLSAHLLGVVEETMRPSQVSLWLTQTEQPREPSRNPR